MPWKERTTMSLRREFVQCALQDGINMSALCREFGISRKTGYKWLRRYQEGGWEALQDRSRRPHTSPNRTPAEIEAQVLAVRQEHPAWGGRKIHAYLRRQGLLHPPSPSTITQILHRHGCIDPEEARKHRPFQRFQRGRPNELWQMDFKSPIALADGTTCYPLTVLDDHSRFLIALYACADQSHDTVQAQLIITFRKYGLPESILIDNGTPWGSYQETRSYTFLEVWMMHLGMQVIHSRPYHPQTLGKDERLHRTLEAELLQGLTLANLQECQTYFDRWRHMYNTERPHEALGMDVPAAHYQPSPRPFPEVLPPILYPPHAIVRKVDVTGRISFHGRTFRVGKAFRGQPVALYPTEKEGVYEVYFCQQRVKTLCLQQPE